MYELRFFKTMFLLLLVVAIIHWVALSYSLYVLIPHLDTIVHAMAGFIIGIAAISVFELIQKGEKIKNRQSKIFIMVLLASLAIGLGWELFEKIIGFTSYLDKVDTSTDLVADVFGSVLAYGMYRFIIW